MNDVALKGETEVEAGEIQPRRPRVAVVVPNPCNPDYRVIKQAEFLAKQGYEVRVFCTQAKDVPSFEEFNDVTYRRIKWHVGEALRRLLGLAPADPYKEIRQRRERFKQDHWSFFRSSDKSRDS